MRRNRIKKKRRSAAKKGGWRRVAEAVGEVGAGDDSEAGEAGEGEASAQPRLRKRKRLSKRARARRAKKTEVVVELAEQEGQLVVEMAEQEGQLETGDMCLVSSGRKTRLPKKKRAKVRAMLQEQHEEETRQWHREVSDELEAMECEDSDIRAETAPPLTNFAA